MEHNPIKQRLVGGIILVSLAVIFLPMVLTERDVHDATDNAVPPVPEAENKPTTIIPLEIKPLEHAAPATVVTTVVEPVPEGMPAETAQPMPTAAPVLTPDVAALVTPVPVERAAPPVPASAPKVVEEVEIETPEPKGDVPAWIVQVGSFSSDKNAHDLRDALRGKGYAAFVEKVESGKAAVFRVSVGPEISTERAEQVKQRLAREMKLNGLVKRYR
ncbi:MAG: SPOR domain-containing protein [Pseudomonadota bacterium]